MDRKTKIMLNALNIKDRSCIDFLKVPKYERLGTTTNKICAFKDPKNYLGT
ncbi:unnamed protein product [Acanthoscelides obtectus]|uniref:Uncharacterized protein n=1 Tax=Acanthoscelides obtectus TaxID=200917 RepID=A0A9P0KHC1_ACAOB|nr:unnamed protein product [Acanthoscelides obtectus]CAK1647600.1 hypothetical protein AOBTE_LOCUS15291 [Acanthoscelides obtectus]